MRVHYRLFFEYYQKDRSVCRQRPVTEVFNEPGLRPNVLRTAHLKNL